MIEILTEMRATSDVSRLHSRRAGQWLSSGFQRRRFAGSGDRAAIGDLFWKIQRASARLDWHLTCLDAPNSPRNMVLAALVLIERQVDELTQLFSADVEYAPSPIDTNEKKLVSALADRNLNDPAMPNHIAFEWPQWLMDDTKAGLGDAVVRELGALLVEAPTDVRINPLKFSDRRKLRDKMAGRNIKVHLTRLSPLGVRLDKRTRLEDLPEWKAGLFDVQDEGSQLAALLCDARPSMQVADICAGAGGKSLVMAANMRNKGRILALDPNAKRLEQCGERLRRAGIHNVERKLVAEKVVKSVLAW